MQGGSSAADQILLLTTTFDTFRKSRDEVFCFLVVLGVLQAFCLPGVLGRHYPQGLPLIFRAAERFEFQRGIRTPELQVSEPSTVAVSTRRKGA